MRIPGGLNLENNSKLCVCVGVGCYSYKLLIDPDNLREWCTRRGLAPRARLSMSEHRGTYTHVFI